MTLCRPLLSLLAAFAASILSSVAQQTITRAVAPGPRLHGDVHSQTRVPLAGSISPQVRLAPDLGPVSPGYPVHGVTLVLRRSPAQQAALESLLTAQQDPASPEFHHWLSPEQFAERFGVAESDLQAVERWLTSQGFTLTGRSRSRDRISFSGTAAQVETAFGAPLHRFEIAGEPHLSPASELSLPSDLAAITSAVLHLADLHPKPLTHLAPHPAFTTSSQQHLLTPPDLAVMYNFAPADSTNNFGQSIAIVGESSVPTNGALASFQANMLAGSAIIPVFVPGSGVEAQPPGALAEADIDLEYVAGIIPSAQTFLVHVGSDPAYNVFDALAYAIDQNIAPVISISYGECETFLSPSDAETGTTLFQQATAQGQTLVAASGDTGSTACAAYETASQFTAAQQQALAVNYPADSPYVTAVGGTQMTSGDYAAGANSFWSGPGSLSGDATLLSYAPEVAWNEGQLISGILAGGGGTSAVFPRPEWQATLPGIPAGNTRLLPDISLQASTSSPGFLFCTDDAAFLGEQGTSSSCTNGLLSSSHTYSVAGGTSFAAPVFAGIVALLNEQQQASGQGNLNPTLYSLASQGTGFHDITAGSIACLPGAALCSVAGASGFPATSGYDQATGLGSLNVRELFQAWPSPTPSAKFHSILSFSSGSTNLFNAPGVEQLLTVDVTAYSREASVPTPTGTLAVRLDGVPVASTPLNTNAVVNYSVETSLFFLIPAQSTPGSHIINVDYSGDSHFEPSSGTTAILVGNVNAVGSVAVAAPDVTLVANGSATSTVIVTPTGGYNGRLLWTFAVSPVASNTTSVSGCFSIPSIAVEETTNVTLSLGTGTACSSALPSVRALARPFGTTTATGNSPSTPWRLVGVAAASLLCTLLPSSRRQRPRPLLGLLLLVALTSGALSGCGSGVSHSTSAAGATAPSAPSSPTSPSVSYIATLTATDSVNKSIQASARFTLTVK